MCLLGNAGIQLYVIGWVFHVVVFLLLVALLMASAMWRSRQIVIEQKLANDYRNIKRLEKAVMQLSRMTHTVTSNQRVLDGKLSLLLKQRTGSAGEPMHDVNYDTGMFDPVEEVPDEHCEGFIQPDPDREGSQQ